MAAVADDWDQGNGSPIFPVGDQRFLLLLVLSVLVHGAILAWLKNDSPVVFRPQDLLVVLQPQTLPEPLPTSLPEPATITPTVKPEPVETLQSEPATTPQDVQAANETQYPPGEPVQEQSTPSPGNAFEWQLSRQRTVQTMAREQAQVEFLKKQQWSKSPSIMWGDVPQPFKRKYQLTDNRPTGLLGDPNVYFGREFQGLGFKVGNCFIGLPKVDLEQLYQDYAERPVSVYPDTQVAPLSFYTCGF